MVVADPLGLDKEETPMSAEETQHGIGPPFHGGTCQGRRGGSRRDARPDFVSHTKLLPGQPPGCEGEKWAIAQLAATFSNRSVVPIPARPER
jgi:hypothetical protein